MKKVLLRTILVFFLLSSCTLQPQPIVERNLSTPTPTTDASENVTPCTPENWVIAITALEQADVGDGTKLVFVKIGIENNDSVWGRVNSPTPSDENESQSNVYLSTMDGTRYGYIGTSPPLFSEQLADSHRAMYETSGLTETPLLPPGFITLGKSINGEPYYYNFAFHIPDSQKPATITIGEKQVQCIQPHVLGGNGKPIYRDKKIRLPAKTYNLETDIGDIREAPSARRYPNLVGAELVTADWKESIFITDVRHNGNEITVVFDFTNFSSHDISPSFTGYIMGNGGLFICKNDCDHRPTQELVQPGRSAQDLTWTFTVPENETNLMFIYVYGWNSDLNEVYRVNLE